MSRSQNRPGEGDSPISPRRFGRIGTVPATAGLRPDGSGIGSQSSEHVGWNFDPPVAEWHCGDLWGRVDVERPDLGVHNLQLAGRILDGRLLALTAIDGRTKQDSRDQTWPAEAAEVYVRENDLVATYRPTKSWPFAPQLYWSGAPNVAQLPASLLPSSSLLAPRPSLPAPCSLSLLVSVQTDLLDTNPEIRVTTCLPAVDVMELRHEAEDQAQALLWRLVERDWSYLEYVPRSDYREIAIGGDEAGNMTCEWRLFGEFLEKGVIRRARVSAAFLPREGDEESAAECCRTFAARPLPLTT